VSKKSPKHQSFGPASVADNPQLGDVASAEDANVQQPINFNIPPPEPDEERKSDRHQESLIGSTQNNAIRIGQSISDSNMDKFDSNVNLLMSQKNEEEPLEMPSSALRKENKSAHF